MQEWERGYTNKSFFLWFDFTRDFLHKMNI